jgi:hypothetical protein
MVGFFEFIMLTWGLGGVVSLISIIEAMKDRSLTASEIAAAFYYAFTAVFAFTILIMAMSPSSATVFNRPLTQLDLLSTKLDISLETVAPILLIVMLLLAVAVAVLVKMGRPITAGIMTMLFLTTGFIGFLILGLQPTLNMVAIALLGAAISLPLAYVIYTIVQR